jgi:CRP-like cAMP-binding protein
VPKSLLYKTNSVIYFKGDRTSSFFVLKSGKVAITSNDDISSLNESGDDTNKRIIGAGEFFGIRSALSGLPQDETAVAMIPSEIIALSHKEFEEIARKHSDIILKLLRVYSKQLVQTHEIVKNLINKNKPAEETDAEAGLYNIGIYFLKNRLYNQCAETLKRYLSYYPEGRFSEDAKAKIEYAESRIGTKEDNQERFFPSTPVAAVTVSHAVSEAESAFNEAKNLFEQKKYAPSVVKFGRIIRESDPSYEPFVADSEYYMSEAFFNLKKYNEVIEQLPSFFQKYPENENTQKALFLLARSYEALNDKKLALIFYQKLYDILPDDSPLKARIKSIVNP